MSDIKLSREYYQNKILTQTKSGNPYKFVGEHEIYGRTKSEEVALKDAGIPNTVIIRCDRMMRYSTEYDMWSEDYRISYTYDLPSKTWKFLNHYEGLNKIR